MPPLLVYIRGAIKYAWNGPSSSFYWYVSEYQPRSHQNLITVAAGLAFWLNTPPRAGERYLNTGRQGRSPAIMTTPGHTSLVTLRSTLQPGEDRRLCAVCRALWTVLLLHYLKHKYRVVTWHCVLLLNIAAHHSRKMLHDPHCRGRGGNLDQVVNFQNYKTAFLPSPHPIIPWWPRPASRYQLPTQQTSYFYHHSDGNEIRR